MADTKTSNLPQVSALSLTDLIAIADGTIVSKKATQQQVINLLNASGLLVSGSLAPGAVTTGKIGPEAVTPDKQPGLSQDTIIGRISSGSGAREELTGADVRTIINVEDGADVTDEANVTDALDGANLSNVPAATGDKILIQDASDSDNLKTVTSFGTDFLEDGSVTEPKIATNAVTFPKMQNISTDSFLGRDTAGSGSVKELSASTARGVLNVEDGADVTDETNVVSSLDGASIPSTTVAGGDKVLLQDISDSENIKVATAQEIADLGAGGGAVFSGALIYKNVDQAVVNNLTTILTWNVEEYDVGGWFSGAGTSFIIPSGVNRVKVTFSVQWESQDDGRRQCKIRKNTLNFVGSAQALWAADDVVGDTDIQNAISAIFSVSTGDAIDLEVFQNSGFSVDIESNSGFSTWFAIEKIS